MENNDRDWRADVYSDDPSTRWDVAGRQDLPVDLMWVLLSDPDTAVVKSLLGNYSAPRELLIEARAARPDLIEQVTLHPNAPLDLAGNLPLWKHTQLSIRSYCRARHLTEDVLGRVVDAWGEAQRGQATTLKDAVETAPS